jgi:hypothetical protein
VAATTIRIDIIHKPKGRGGFAGHVRRWVIESFFACINRNHRLPKNVEATIPAAAAFLYAASAILPLPRLAHLIHRMPGIRWRA